MTAFRDFHPALQSMLVHRIGWQTLRPVQELAATAILQGDNTLILAPTAGGKTEAAFFPVLSQVLQQPAHGVRAIYISPLKALLNNQSERLTKYANWVGLQAFNWHGDITATAKKYFLKAPTELLLTTPESLEAMLISERVKPQQWLQDLGFIVIDEIHALAGCERGAHLLGLLERLAFIAQRDFQRIGLSATVGNTAELLTWLHGSSQRAKALISPPQVAGAKQLEVYHQDELALARIVLHQGRQRKSLLFCESRAATERLAQTLRERDLDIRVHHSSVAAEERRQSEEALASGQNVCIICTSTLELGLDVGELDKVFQIDAPMTVAAFLQRLGRTGRRIGTTPHTAFLTTTAESLVQAIAIIELARQKWVESLPLPNRCWQVLVHQIMALVLQQPGIGIHPIWQILKPAHGFKGIADSEFNRLMQDLLAAKWLHSDQGHLTLGQAAEQQFGRRHFMALFSVFSSPQAYQVQVFNGPILGELDAAFADTLGLDDGFLLNGMGWLIVQIDEVKRILWVKPGATGQAPRWGGFSPKILSYELCQSMLQVLTSSDTYAYCSPQAQQALQHLRQQQPYLQTERWHTTEQEIQWWTYAGGRINQTLKKAVEYVVGYTIKANNYGLIFDPEQTSIKTLRRLLAQINTDEFWQKRGLQEHIASTLPQQKISKFQDGLAGTWQQELLIDRFLDMTGAQQFLYRTLHKTERLANPLASLK